MDLDTQTWVIVGVAVGVVVLVALVAWLVARRSQHRTASEKLRGRFGGEYDATVDRLGRRNGEQDLRDRMRHFSDLELERVAPDDREAFTQRWKEIQYRFLEDPSYSVREAEHLVDAVMRERGFPAADFDTRARSISIEYPDLAEPYRSSYRTFRLVEDGTAAVEETYHAMLGYRQLFETLIERPKHESGVEGSAPPERERAL